MAPTSRPQPGPCDLFTFLRVAVPALAREHLPIKVTPGRRARLIGAAVLLAVAGKGTTGRGVTVDEDALGEALDVSRASVWRYVSDLDTLGLIEQTERPTTGRKGRAGRRARYRLMVPPWTLSCLSADAEQRDTTPAQIVSQQSRSTARHDSDPSRVSISAESCLNDHAQQRDSSTSDGSTSVVTVRMHRQEPRGASTATDACDDSSC